MFSAALRILLKVFELIGCIACLIIKNLTDQEARRIAIRNQKYSREWSLLNNVTWSREGNAFASVTYGGFTLITSLLLISRCISARSKPNLTEKIFLTVGMIFFFTIGSLVYASLEQVPHDLHDNAIVLGSLSFLVAILYLIDLADPIGRNRTNFTQTEYENFNKSTVQTQTTNIITAVDNNLHHYKNFQRNESIHHNDKNTFDETIPPTNGYYFAGDQVDIVHTKILPSSQQPIFSKILLPEKRRPYKEKIIEPKRLNDHQQIHTTTNYDDNELTYRYDSQDHHSHRNYEVNQRKFQNDITDDDENLDRPIKLGFVAQAARMWDRKAKRNNRLRELGTVV